MKKLLLVVLALGFLLRVIGLSSYPSGFTPDEASFGYDAYSILKTGKDQWGKSFPLVLQSFGDYKSPLYSYITIPFVAVFGLNKTSVRLPNAVVGTMAIYVTFLLVYELLKNDYLQLPRGFDPKKIALAAATLLAISPWHIMMSRGAFEANLTTLLIPLAVYFFVKALNNPKYYIYSSIVIGLNIFSYHSAKFVTPILFLSLIILFRKQILIKFGVYRKIAILILIIIASLFLISLKTGSSTRIFDISIFKTALTEASYDRTSAINQGMDPLLARMIYNKYEAGFRHFFINYLTYYSPQFYFTQGPAESTYGMIPGRGVLYWFELPLLALGIFYLLRNFKNKFALLFLIWYLTATIPAALTLGPGYAANRAEVILPSIQIISAFGLVLFVSLLSSNVYKIFKLFGGICILLFFSYFVFDYFVLSPQKISEGMLYGNYEAAVYLSKNYTQDTIVVSRKLSEPHIYIAFANHWDPADYQRNSKNWNYKNMNLGWVDQMPEYHLGNYTFKNIDYSQYQDKNVILVGKAEEFPQDIVFSKQILFPNNKVAIKIVDIMTQHYAYRFKQD